MLDGLPADTAAVLALGLPDGWAEQVLTQVSEVSGLSTEELAAEATDELGIGVPEDLETLLGDGAALAVSPDVDVEGLADGSTPPEEALVGARIRTDDPEASAAVLDELRGRLPDPDLLATDAEGDLLAVGPDEGYRADLLADGGLLDAEAFTDVVPEADRSSAVLYLDLDVVEDYADLLDDLTGDPRVADNLAPLSALGVSAWTEDDVPHGLLRIGTD
ncbi:hypothetical protein GCM10009737_11620 [Nocardioides lentus]|uniref:Uncharacterized protein n=1 Tax=Nocardioides lentus TaxID=338077 RepID=A0ABP5AFD8_9ACTN